MPLLLSPSHYGLSCPASLPAFAVAAPHRAHYSPTPGSLHCGSQTNLGKDMVGSCHLKVSSRVAGPQLEEIIQGRGLSRAGGRAELSGLGPEALWFLMGSWNKQGRGGRRILTGTRDSGQTWDCLQHSPSSLNLYIAANTQRDYSETKRGMYWLVTKCNDSPTFRRSLIQKF